MLSYILRRLMYVPLIVAGVMMLTFSLFFGFQERESIARRHLGKNPTPEAVVQWLEVRGYDKPLVLNFAKGESIFDSIYFNEMGKLLTLNFGASDRTLEPLGPKIAAGAIPSLTITLPAFFVGLFLAVSISLYLVLVRYSLVDRWGTFVCVAIMSVVPMLYIFLGQALFALNLKWFPASGYDLSQFEGIRFLILPVCIFAVIHLGHDTRLYRAVFLEEIAKDYVRTARAKGVSNERLLFTHVLGNGMIALITLVVAHLPLLVLGSLLIENFFSIPGLGNLLATAIQTDDFSTMRAAVFIGSILYQGGLIATDICYALADPRIRLS